MYQIDKNIPFPKNATVSWGQYPFAKMEVGDSFKAPIKKKKSVGSLASVYGKKNGMKFSMRSMKSCLRIWRIK